MNLNKLKIGQSEVILGAPKETLKDWAKKIKKVEMAVGINMSGTQYGADGNLDMLMGDFRTLYNKDFFERHDKAFGFDFEKDFDEDDFDENKMYTDNVNMTLTYYIEFADKSEILLDFEVDDYASGDPEYQINKSGKMAQEFESKSKKKELQWDTDDLEKLIK